MEDFHDAAGPFVPVGPDQVEDPLGFEKLLIGILQLGDAVGEQHDQVAVVQVDFLAAL